MKTITFSLILFTLLLTPPFPISYLQSFAQEDDLSDTYIVVLKDSFLSAQDTSTDFSKKYGLSIEHTYERALKGYSAKVPKQKVEQLKKDGRVHSVVPDRVIHKLTTTQGQVPSTGFTRIKASLNAANKGTGIGVAVIDTGIDLNHPDLKTNIIADTSCVKNVKTSNDDDGHGTHVAGIIAALNNSMGVVGVAPEAKLIAVKVLNSKGDGSWSKIICGIDWVTKHAQEYNIKVVNMSLGGPGSSDGNCGNNNSDPLHKAICRSRDAGITYVVAAGNESTETRKSVPASYDDAVITVSALTNDTFASFSNFGPEVDIGAPGVNIRSTWLKGTYRMESGTSMATPFVSGAAALYLKKFPGSSWQQVRDGLRSRGETLNHGHTDPSGKHPEPVILVDKL